MFGIHNVVVLLLPYLAAESAIDSSCGVSDYQIETLMVPSVITSGAPRTANIKRIVGQGMKECIQSCCNWTDCQYAVIEDSVCFNVHCKISSDCRLVPVENSRLNDTKMRETVLVRQVQILCPNQTKSCEAGVDNCHENEECVPLSTRGRGGCCRCIPGFVQGSDGVCLSFETSTHPPTTTPYIKHLAISISPTVIQLPEAQSSITAIVVPGPDTGETYVYKWVVVSYPEGPQGVVEDSNERVLKLSGLSPGNYTVRITVNSTLSFGESYANFTVLPPKRVNIPPVAVIRPSLQTIHLPNDVSILDGSPSTDDNGIVSYIWTLERGPLSYQFQSIDSETLKLEGLVEGNYTFLLTVVDADGAKNSTNATLEVLKETDYPPEANAGAPVEIYLPQNNLTLNGNASTDDHGIVSWEWTLVSDDSKNGGSGPGADPGGQSSAKPVDMQHSRTPYLQLTNLEEGMYRFQLKVTDAAGQSSTAQVDVFVRHPAVAEPRVDAGPDQVVNIPVNWVLLDGSKSIDETAIAKWEWKKVQGPNEVVFSPSNDKAQVNATALTKGVYVFQLTAWNTGGFNGSDNVSVTVLQKENVKPVANAGGDRSVTLPLKWITLNGSLSSDDLGIVSWLWTREPESLAAGTIVANSDRTSTLMLTNLIPGTYKFRLTVSDEENKTSSDVVTLIVHPNPREMDVVVMTLQSDPRAFTERELTALRGQIGILLHELSKEDININVDDVIVEPKTGFIVIQFLTTTKSDSSRWQTLAGTQVVALLKRKLRNDPNMMVFPVVNVDTAICQNNCSGHGVCDQVTRRCACNPFWMENAFVVYNGGEHNCDWSLLYVVIIAALLITAVAAGLWSLVHVCRRGKLPCQSAWCSRRNKRRRPHRYSPLGDPADMRMSTKISHSLLPSDLEDSETESDVVFDTKEANGVSHRPNGTNGTYRSLGTKSDEVHA